VNILLVEDDRDLQRFLSKAFREEGYAVAEAESGDRALERALDGTYTRIILDVMLSGRNGFGVVEEFTSSSSHAGVDAHRPRSRDRAPTGRIAGRLHHRREHARPREHVHFVAAGRAAARRFRCAD
jgi:CheY-like chemotaxis protein